MRVPYDHCPEFGSHMNGPCAPAPIYLLTLLLAGLSVILALVSVDEHVDRGVDGQEDVADNEHDDDALLVAALLDPLQFGQLVNVEEEPRWHTGCLNFSYFCPIRTSLQTALLLRKSFLQASL